MQRFFFHLHNDVDASDDEGTELADLDAARAFALTQARSVMAAMITEEGRIVLSHRIDVEDELGAVLAGVTFGHAVVIEK